ncbi:MAG: alanine--tRNA ligase [Candidatus Hepatoplasma scabrum]|nr:MAG: alanine--tRNA ligase [Candidatus Hepatoplasma sp.]
MKKLNSIQIRKLWIDFFTKKNHLLISSSSLIPKNDNSLLWINSGVATLKNYFSAEKKPPSKKLVNYQRSIRTGDIDKIGITARHQTLFEMLGNFSIGDYFKKEAIDYAYELLFAKEYFAFTKEKIYITVFNDDQNAYDFWIKKGIAKNHLFKMGRETNFWDIGKGPCGPSTEIFYDRGKEYDKRDASILIKDDIENDRFIEIWNIVFSEFSNDGKGNYQELPQKNIDTGAGLERLTMIFEDTPTTFETDIFKPIIKELEKFSSYNYLWDYHPTKLWQENKKQAEVNSEFKKIADFTRAITFMLADQANFSATGRGYVIRRLLREAIITAEQLEISFTFLRKIIAIICENEKERYPYLILNQNKILNLVIEEGEKFNKTYKQALAMFLKYKKENRLNTEQIFKLHETYGLPLNLSYIKKLTSKYQIEIDYQKLLELNNQFKLKSKQNANFIKGMEIQKKLFPKLKETLFLGYNDYKNPFKAKVIAILDNYLVCDKTIFYPTSGGQESDLGTIDNVNVLTVFKTENDLIIHLLEENPFKIGQHVELKIDLDRRKKLTNNHSATHLLFKALEIILKQDLKQVGSKVAPSFLRFDFSYQKEITKNELDAAENLANNWIKKGFQSEIKILKLKEALKLNPGYLEGKNYKESVRIVKLTDETIDLCGGTHVTNIKEIEAIKIAKLEKKGSGIYRLQAITGKNNIKSYFVKENEEIWFKIADPIIKNLDDIFLNDQKILTADKISDLKKIQTNLNKLKFDQQNFNQDLNNLIDKSQVLIDWTLKIKTQQLELKLKEILATKEDIIYLNLKKLNLKNLTKIAFKALLDKEEKTLLLALFDQQKYTLFIVLGQKSKFKNRIIELENKLNEFNLKGGGKNYLYVFGGKIDNLKMVENTIIKFLKEKK